MNKNFFPYRLRIWFQLMRFNQPIGFLLLLWPTLWALWLASNKTPNTTILIIFVLGVFFMRTAGCIINDYIDCKIDRHVKRTNKRPLSNGNIDKKYVKYVLFVFLGISYILVLFLNKMTVKLSIMALLFTCIYPFMKRYIYLPQLILGITFSWSILMVFMAINEHLSKLCWILFLANVSWIIAYDTEYAMIDRDDDLRIGIKSTAILFGNFDKIIVSFLQIITLLLLTIIGYLMTFGLIFYLSLTGVAILFIKQQILLTKNNRQAYFLAFLNNNYVGMLVFIGIYGEIFIRNL